MGVMLVIALVPASYLVVLGLLFVKRRRRGLGVSLLLFTLALAAGWWAIFQSRSSTAGVGLLFLPFIAVLAGALGWVFPNLRGAQDATARFAGWFCLAGALAIIGWEVYGGLETVALNRSRDADQRARSLRIDQGRARVKELLARSPGDEAAALARLIAESAEDPEVLLPALESRFASPEDLDRFARPDELSLTLTALRNESCASATLVRIYRTHTYPDYFLQALSAHPNTPPELLREIHAASPRKIMGLDTWLAKNPATPRDVLQALARSSEVSVIQGLLQNPGLTCNMLPEVARSLAASSRPEDGYSTRRLAELRSSLCP